MRPVGRGLLVARGRAGCVAVAGGCSGLCNRVYVGGRLCVVAVGYRDALCRLWLSAAVFLAVGCVGGSKHGCFLLFVGCVAVPAGLFFGRLCCRRRLPWLRRSRQNAPRALSARSVGCCRSVVRPGRGRGFCACPGVGRCSACTLQAACCRWQTCCICIALRCLQSAGCRLASRGGVVHAVCSVLARVLAAATMRAKAACMYSLRGSVVLQFSPPCRFGCCMSASAPVFGVAARSRSL